MPALDFHQSHARQQWYGAIKIKRKLKMKKPKNHTAFNMAFNMDFNMDFNLDFLENLQKTKQERNKVSPAYFHSALDLVVINLVLQLFSSSPIGDLVTNLQIAQALYQNFKDRLKKDPTSDVFFDEATFLRISGQTDTFNLHSLIEAVIKLKTDLHITNLKQFLIDNKLFPKVNSAELNQ